VAKPLAFEFCDRSVEVGLEKVDRTKLYGWVDVEVQDDAGRPCELATLVGDGHSVVGKGGTAIAYLTADGLWTTRAELRPVDANGQPVTPVKSSFDAPIKLDATATPDEFLEHNVHLIYQVVPTTGFDELLAELTAGTIYHFPFSYRGGVEASPAFLLLGGDGTPFLCVGAATALEFVGPAATAPAAEESADAGDEDALDFSLV